ncbi:MAG: translation elongation factor Ts [Myxococcaceae bacterium]|nr:translation elongation factor Ts [Myxococcaceae bacterium]
MAEISATMVKDLREKTGAGMMDCKKALAESGGDFTKAEEWLRKKGISKAASKGSRVAAEGLIGALVEPRLGVLVEVNCETDFVARNPDFVALTTEAAAHVAKSNPADVAAMLEQGWVKDSAKKTKDVLTEKVAKIGENITVRRFVRYEAQANSALGAYVHSNGRLAVLVELGTPSEAAARSEDVVSLAKELAMQVAGVKAQYVSREQVPADVLEKEKEIYKAELAAAKKPEAIWDKILQGKLEKFYEGVCLVDQIWVKDDKKKIKNLVGEVGKKVGGELTVRRFARLEVGEGIEKKKEDLAAEVAKTIATA